jgi:hypothetical protein
MVTCIQSYVIPDTMMNVRKSCGELLHAFHEPALRLPFTITGLCLATNNSISLLLSTNNSSQYT